MDLEGLKAGRLQIDVNPAAQRQAIEVWWRGTSEDRQPSRALDPFFGKLLAEAEAQKTTIEMHFDTIEYFNSATISCIIQLIRNARASGVRLTLVYSQAQKWQEVSFRALRVIAKADQSVEFKAI